MCFKIKLLYWELIEYWHYLTALQKLTEELALQSLYSEKQPHKEAFWCNEVLVPAPSSDLTSFILISVGFHELQCNYSCQIVIWDRIHLLEHILSPTWLLQCLRYSFAPFSLAGYMQDSFSHLQNCLWSYRQLGHLSVLKVRWRIKQNLKFGAQEQRIKPICPFSVAGKAWWFMSMS